tara:strand:+ start:453 stop:719 length:267 start_codon:yes stop_codon:yes gene_type:complete
MTIIDSRKRGDVLFLQMRVIIMKAFFNIVTDKSVLAFLEWSLNEQVVNGKDSFEISRMCVSWGLSTGLKSYGFREALESHLDNVKRVN